MDSDEAKEEIKRRADLAAIIKQDTPLQRAGSRPKGRIPLPPGRVVRGVDIRKGPWSIKNHSPLRMFRPSRVVRFTPSQERPQWHN